VTLGNRCGESVDAVRSKVRHDRSCALGGESLPLVIDRHDPRQPCDRTLHGRRQMRDWTPLLRPGEPVQPALPLGWIGSPHPCCDAFPRDRYAGGGRFTHGSSDCRVAHDLEEVVRILGPKRFENKPGGGDGLRHDI